MSRNLFAVALVLAASSFTSAFAGESLSNVQAESAKKAALFDAMNERLGAHKEMSREEILTDLQARAARNREVLVRSGATSEMIAGFDANAAKANAQMEALDKDGILAMETARVQELMTSTNFMFAFMKWNFAFIESSQGAGIGYRALTIFCTPFAILFDIVLLPFELLVSLVTGF